jgi:GTP-binding protein
MPRGGKSRGAPRGGKSRGVSNGARTQEEAPGDDTSAAPQAPRRAARSGGVDALPQVAILGRPNVGKSTLFNALLSRRRSITHADPGVTRDPVEVECSLGGGRVRLVDTGGYSSDARDLDGEVARRALTTARQSDLLLLVLDAVETTPQDEEFIRLVRPFSEKVLLVVNKVDTPDRDTLVWNAHAHGFPHVIGVSAAHGRSIDRLRETVAALLEELREAPLPGDTSSETASAEEPLRQAPADSGAEVRVAVLGKPNTGKSSLANRLLGEERSIVSSIPGTTRDVVEGTFTHRGRRLRILDTAGIRRKARVTDPVEYYSVNRAIESIGRADIVVLMFDAAAGIVDQDKKIAAQAVKEGRGIVLVPGKWDLQKDTASLRESVRELVRFQFPVLGFAPIVPVSALTGYGVRGLLDIAVALWDKLHRRVGTGRLNQALESWMTHYKLPVRGKNYKIRFMTQVGTNPVRFVAFVNRMSGFPEGYAGYLENCIRRDLGFSDIPVTVEFRQSRKTAR